MWPKRETTENACGEKKITQNSYFTWSSKAKVNWAQKRWWKRALCRWVQFWLFWCDADQASWMIQFPILLYASGANGGILELLLNFIKSPVHGAGYNQPPQRGETVLHSCRIFDDWTFRDVCFLQLSSPTSSPPQGCHFHWLCYDDLCMPVWRQHGIWLSCGNWNRILKFLHRHLELASSFHFALQNARESYALLPSLLFT